MRCWATTDRARWDLPDLRVRADREEKGDRWGQWGREAFRVLRDRRASRDRPVRPVPLLRQYMHNTEIAVTMRLSTILKTIKQPL